MSDNLLDSQKDDPKWFIEEGRPGEGDRPSWLPDKFKSVADMGKSYSELEKKFGYVPENYDLSGSKFIDQEHSAIKDFLTTARDKKVPKDVIDKMVSSFDSYLGEHDVNPDEEFKKLGDNAEERLKILNNWAQANLSEDSYKALSRNLQSADSIKALEELRGKIMNNNTVITNGNDGTGSEGDTVASLQKEIVSNYEKYKTDPKYRAEVGGKLEVAVKRAGMVDKFGS